MPMVSRILSDRLKSAQLVVPILDISIRSVHNDGMPSSTYDPRNAALYRAVGALVAAERGVLGLTQDQVAQRTGRRLSRAAVANIESGRQRVAVHHLFDLAHALGVAPATLLPDEGQIPPLPTQAAEQLRDRVAGRTGGHFLESKTNEEGT